MARAMGDVGTPKQVTQAAIALSVVGGILGSFFDDGSDGALLFFSLAGLGVMAYAPLLAVEHIRAGRVLAGAGFAALVITIPASAVAGYSGPGADAVFVSISLLMLPGLLLLAAQDWGAVWGRGAAALAGLLFAIWGYVNLLGDDLPDSDDPLLVIAWIAFTIAEISWFLKLNESESAPTAPAA